MAVHAKYQRRKAGSKQRKFFSYQHGTIDRMINPINKVADAYSADTILMEFMDDPGNNHPDVR